MNLNLLVIGIYYKRTVVVKMLINYFTFLIIYKEENIMYHWSAKYDSITISWMNHTIFLKEAFTFTVSWYDVEFIAYSVVKNEFYNLYVLSKTFEIAHHTNNNALPCKLSLIRLTRIIKIIAI